VINNKSFAVLCIIRKKNNLKSVNNIVNEK